MRPFTGGNTVKIIDTAKWLTAGAYRVELQDAGGVTVGAGTFTVSAAAALTGSFTAPRTWSWTETVAAAIEARVLEPATGPAVPGVSNIGAKTFVGAVTYTPAAGSYALQLRNANFVVINATNVTVP